MPIRDEFIMGDWNVACSMCGRKRKASRMVKNWQGMWRCPEHNEPRHPQDFVRGVKEQIGVPWAQPMIDLAVNVCTFNGQSAVPLFAMPGCMVPGRDNIDWDSVSTITEPQLCDIYGIQAVPSYAMPGCSIPGEDPMVPEVPQTL